MKSSDFLRKRALQYRRLAYAIPLQEDPTRVALLVLADEFETEAAAAASAMADCLLDRSRE